MKKIVNIVPQLPWAHSNGTMSKDKITRLVIHHEGVKTPMFYDTVKRIKQDAAYHISKGWGHISYHYMMDNVGDIYQCLPDSEIGYHAGNLPVNKSSIALCVQGNYNEQKLSAKQEKSLKEFCEYMFERRPDLPKLLWKGLVGHREVRVGGTSCPGNNLFAIINKW